MRFVETSTDKTTGAFALIITVIMVALAAVIAITLLTNASTDRLTATSLQHRYEAELAAQNGLEAAKHALTADGNGNLISNNDLFVVTRVAATIPASTTAEDTTAHYYYLGQTKAGATNVTYYPLFSGGTSQTVALNAQPAFTAFDTSLTTTAVNLPALLPDPATSPTQPLLPAVTTKWIDIVDPKATPAPGPALRYCYWIEDLGGYIDADVAGNIFGKDGAGNNNQTHTRDPSIMQPLIDAGNAKPGSLLAMWTIFNSAATDPAASPQFTDNQSIVSNRAALFTSETVKQAIVSSSAQSYLSKISRHVVSGLKADSEQEVIPYGFSYGSEGAPKTDINAKIAAKDVDGLANPIKTSLPNWASTRRGGYPYQTTANTAAAEDSYRRTIAANIIGYAQPIGDAPITGADYRGTGPYPLVNEFYDYANWTGVSSSSITIAITSWVELWNMSNQTITGDVRYTDYYRHAVDVGAFTYFDDNHDPDKPDPGETIGGYPFAPQTITMAPNEFRVLQFGPATYTLSTGGTIPASPLTLHFRTTGRYKLEWKSASAGNFVVVDQPLGNLQMNTDTIYNPQESSSKVPYKWNGCQPGFVYYGGVAKFYYNPGDPRSAYYNSVPQASNDYSSNATMWYRNQKPSSTNVLAKQVKVSAWPDGGHDTALGTAGTKDTISPPTTAPAGANSEPTKAPSVISGAGKLKSITELANIYDPCQWNIVPDANNHWSQIDSNATADSHYGGGLTLRIGRAEFTRFDKDGSRGSDLLNVFAVNSRRDTQGLVNLNTATRETLRALGSGLILNRDPDIVPNTLKNNLYPPTNSDQADKFADAVISTRNTKPFVSTAQLAQLNDSSAAAFFGNTVQWALPQTAPTEWNDAAAEEYFARIFDLCSVRSRNFRVFVTGQYVDPRYSDPVTGKPPLVLSTAKKVYHVFINPTRAADGSIQSQQIQVTYAHDL